MKSQEVFILALKNRNPIDPSESCGKNSCGTKRTAHTN
jgi:hypothetical protein